MLTWAERFFDEFFNSNPTPAQAKEFLRVNKAQLAQLKRARERDPNKYNLVAQDDNIIDDLSTQVHLLERDVRWVC